MSTKVIFRYHEPELFGLEILVRNRTAYIVIRQPGKETFEKRLFLIDEK